MFTVLFFLLEEYLMARVTKGIPSETIQPNNFQHSDALSIVRSYFMF